MTLLTLNLAIPKGNVSFPCVSVCLYLSVSVSVFLFRVFFAFVCLFVCVFVCLFAKPLSRVMVDMTPVSLEPDMSVLKCARVTTITKHLRTQTTIYTNCTQQLSVAAVREQRSYISSAPSFVGCPSEPPTNSRCHSQRFWHVASACLKCGSRRIVRLFGCVVVWLCFVFECCC